MDYLELIEETIKCLNNNGFKDKSIRIEDLYNNSFTSSELLMSVTTELIKLVNNSYKIRKLLENDVKNLSDYCYNLGLQLNTHIKR